MLAALGNIIGSVANGIFGMKNANTNKKMQLMFAKNGISWKVADAKKAGIHPLAALGAQTHSYSPVSIGTPDFASAGQSLGRAIDATQDQPTRDATRLALEKAGLENDLIRTQIASARVALSRAMAPPAPPSPYGNLVEGQPSSGVTPGHPETKIERPQFTTHLNTPLGYRIHAAPYLHDVQSWEDRYGESALSPAVLAGWGNFIRDHLNTGNLHLEQLAPGFYEWFMRNYGVRR